ncbi:MAG: helix-turn-helix domain-containing protein, partial [Mycobacteriales bacterium]
PCLFGRIGVVPVLVLSVDAALGAKALAMLEGWPDRIAVTTATGAARDSPRAQVYVAAARCLADIPTQVLDGAASLGRPVVLFTDVTDHEAVFEALARGVRGYLATVSDLELVAALGRVAAGQIVIDPVVGAALAAQIVASGSPLEPVPDRWGLGRRECQVLELLTVGCSNREISNRLYITEHTVKTHLRSLYRKLGARNRAEAIAIALGRAK